jgi:transposase-like protein
MDKGRFLIEMHLQTGKPIKELAAAHGVSESWLFKLLRRYRLEGPSGLVPRSRRPKTGSSDSGGVPPRPRVTQELNKGAPSLRCDSANRKHLCPSPP